MAFALAGMCGRTAMPDDTAIAGEPPTSSAPVSLAQLAHEADFVGVAQIRDTDYLRRRDIPVSGSAYLQVLITYKSAAQSAAKSAAGEELIEVYEKGLHEHECYFPNPSVFEEGRRYLLFLRRDPEHAERYRGFKEGCAIDVLVDSDNRYAVRLPVTGIQLTDSLQELARPMQFADPYAAVDDEALPATLRDAMRAAGEITPWPAEEQTTDSADPLPPSPSPPRQWIYTRGVPLSEFRELLEKKGSVGPAGDKCIRPLFFLRHQPVTGLVGLAAG
ncbi:MAG: hypothetical protein ACSLE2_08065 [Lysobacterales bacterium]